MILITALVVTRIFLTLFLVFLGILLLIFNKKIVYVKNPSKGQIIIQVWGRILCYVASLAFFVGALALALGVFGIV